MSYETLAVTRGGHVAVVKLTRPDSLNALNTRMAVEVAEVFTRLAADEEVFAAVLTGAGDRAFCVGADLKERQGMSKDDMKRQRALFVTAFSAVMNFPKPLIAAVNGHALGGGFEFALCCDFIVAADTASFGLPEVGLAIIPGGGGTQLLPRAIGRNRAKELIYTGRRLTAAEAHAWGIVNHVVPAAELDDYYMKLAQDIARNGPVALQQAKKAINIGADIELHAALLLEAECYNACLFTEDRDEGLRAFHEKRSPVYRGR